MKDQSSSLLSQNQNSLCIAPLSLMVDKRLTPLDCTCWIMMNALRSAGGLYTLAGLGQLRSYLACTPLADRSSYETASRALTSLRITGWVSLVGHNRDLMTGNVLNDLYQINESALSFEDACTLDASLPALLVDCVGHKHTHLNSVGRHVQASLERVPKAAFDGDQAESDEDDEPPPPPSSRKLSPSPEKPVLIHPRTRTSVTQQNSQERLEPFDDGSTYKNKSYKKKRTYRAHTREESDSKRETVTLPPCLASAKADQQQDMLTALTRLPSKQRQEVLDELQARSQGGSVRDVVAYFFGLVRRVASGDFRPWAGRKRERKIVEAVVIERASRVATRVTAKPPAQPQWAERGRPHIANIRKILDKPRKAGELAAQTMENLAQAPLPV